LIIDMLAVGYSCPTRHVPTYIIPEKEIILLGWFHRDSFKTDRLDCGETDMPRPLKLYAYYSPIRI